MRRAVLILLLVPALAGCAQAGGSSTADFKGDERNVADAISDFSSSASRKEASKACSESLSSALRDKVAQGGKDCTDELKKAFDDTDLQTIDIDDVTIEGSTATAKVSTSSGDDDFQSTFTLSDEDGDWHIDSFGDGDDEALIAALIALALVAHTDRQAVYDIPTPPPATGLQIALSPRLLVIDKRVPVACAVDGVEAPCRYELRTTAEALLGVGGSGAVAGDPHAILLSKGGIRAVSAAPGGVPVTVTARVGGLKTTAAARLFVQNLTLHVANPKRLRPLARTLRRAGVDRITCRGTPRRPVRAACRGLRAGGLDTDYVVKVARGGPAIVVTYSPG